MTIKIKYIKHFFSKDLINNIKGNVKKVFNQVKKEKRMKSCCEFINLTIRYIFMTIILYDTTINSSIENNKHNKIYSMLKNKHYDFSSILTGLSYDFIEKLFEDYKGKDASYISRNRLHLIFDPSNKLHSGKKIEKTRKLYGSSSPTNFDGIAFKGLTLVGSYKGLIFPIDAMLDDPDLKKHTPNEVLKDMLYKLLFRLQQLGYDTSTIRFSADREFLNWELVQLLRYFGVSVVLKAKKNTKLSLIGLDIPHYSAIEWAELVVTKDLGSCNNSSLNQYLSKRDKEPLYYCVKDFHCDCGNVRAWVFYDDKAKELVGTNDFWKHVEVFICTDANMRAKEVYEEYHKHRWSIEVPYHKGLKSEIEVEKSYQGRTFTGHNNQWILKTISMFILFYENIQRKSWRLSYKELKRKYNELYIQLHSTGHLQGISCELNNEIPP